MKEPDEVFARELRRLTRREGLEVVSRDGGYVFRRRKAKDPVEMEFTAEDRLFLKACGTLPGDRRPEERRWDEL